MQISLTTEGAATEVKQQNEITLSYTDDQVFEWVEKGVVGFTENKSTPDLSIAIQHSQPIYDLRLCLVAQRKIVIDSNTFVIEITDRESLINMMLRPFSCLELDSLFPPFPNTFKSQL